MQKHQTKLSTKRQVSMGRTFTLIQSNNPDDDATITPNIIQLSQYTIPAPKVDMIRMITPEVVLCLPLDSHDNG